MVLADGRVFHVGGNSNTAIYSPSDTPGGTGTWVAGPVIPDGLTSWTAAAATMPNGRVLFVAGHATSNGPIHVFEFDPTAPIESSLSDVTPTGLGEGPAFASRMVVLPTGQVLVVLPATTGIHHVYTPDGAPDANWKPAITSIVASGSNLYTLTGRQLTGVTSGANNRDNGAGETSRPIVQLTNSTGKVFYARTFDWSTNAIATGSTPVTTEFALPEWVPADVYSLTVIANGISSDPVPFTVVGTKFYVVDDAVNNITYRYAPDGATRGSASLDAGNTTRGVCQHGCRRQDLGHRRQPQGVRLQRQRRPAWVLDGRLAGQQRHAGRHRHQRHRRLDRRRQERQGVPLRRRGQPLSRAARTPPAASISTAATPTPRTSSPTARRCGSSTTAATDKVFKYTLAGSSAGKLDDQRRRTRRRPASRSTRPTSATSGSSTAAPTASTSTRPRPAAPPAANRPRRPSPWPPATPTRKASPTRRRHSSQKGLLFPIHLSKQHAFMIVRFQSSTVPNRPFRWRLFIPRRQRTIAALPCPGTPCREAHVERSD